MIKLRYITALTVLLLIIHSFASADNWPGWRGPNGDGTSSETNLPLKWDSTTNVIWKIPVPGIGYSSPIVWEERLFTVTATEETHEKKLLCYDTKNGSLLWQVTILKSPFESKHMLQALRLPTENRSLYQHLTAIRLL